MMYYMIVFDWIQGQRSSSHLISPYIFESGSFKISEIQVRHTLNILSVQLKFYSGLFAGFGFLIHSNTSCYIISMEYVQQNISIVK